MAAAAGRLAVLAKNSTAIAGVRVTGIEWGGDPIDITNADSAGLREALPVISEQSITLTVEGVQKDAVLRDIALTPATSKRLTDLTFKFADALSAKDTIAGDFDMTGYKEDNPHDDAATFSATFVSSGTWTFS